MSWLKNRKLHKLVLQVPSKITLYHSKSDEDETPFDVVVYNNTQKNIGNLEVVIESSKDIAVSINKNMKTPANSSGLFDLKPNGRRFYIPQVEILESAKDMDTLQVSLLMNKKKVIERQVSVEIR